MTQKITNPTHLDRGDWEMPVILGILLLAVVLGVIFGPMIGKPTFHDGSIHVDSQGAISFTTDAGTYSKIPKEIVTYAGGDDLKDGQVGCLKTQKKDDREKYAKLYAGGNCKEYKEKQDKEKDRNTPVYVYPVHISY
jgi:hypothetical protein